MAFGVFDAFRMKQALTKLASTNAAMAQVMNTYDEIESQSVQMSSQVRIANHKMQSISSNGMADAQGAKMRVAELEEEVRMLQEKLEELRTVAAQLKESENTLELRTAENEHLKKRNTQLHKKLNDCAADEIAKQMDDLQHQLREADSQRDTALAEQAREMKEATDEQVKHINKEHNRELGKMKAQLTDAKRKNKELGMQVKLLEQNNPGDAAKLAEDLASAEKARDAFRDELREMRTELVVLRQQQKAAATPAKVTDSAARVDCCKCFRTVSTDAYCGQCFVTASSDKLLSAEQMGPAAAQVSKIFAQLSAGSGENGAATMRVAEQVLASLGITGAAAAHLAREWHVEFDSAKNVQDKNVKLVEDHDALSRRLRYRERENKELKLALEELRTKLQEFSKMAEKHGLKFNVDGLLESVGITAEVMEDDISRVWDRLYKDAERRIKQSKHDAGPKHTTAPVVLETVDSASLELPKVVSVGDDIRQSTVPRVVGSKRLPAANRTGSAWATGGQRAKSPRRQREKFELMVGPMESASVDTLPPMGFDRRDGREGKLYPHKSTKKKRTLSTGCDALMVRAASPG
mmetsp:Transcript_22305/g.56862  ORF Transcript_22305/g.56862 Transcript_22305/m.56862 type:complete len:580 (+) Transcript_22305:56-1795(+)